MSFRSDEIASVLQKEIETFQAKLDVEQIGRVLEVGDGIARVYGLSDAMAMEMIEFDDGRHTQGLVFNVEESSLGVVILGDYKGIQEGTVVRGTGSVFEVPVGPEVLGRVVTPTGQPMDGKGPIASTHSRPVELIAPGIAQRQPVKVPLMTGIKAIDSMIPIGRGQRELIIGDRKTGKTAIAIDTIINQKGKGVKCFYVAVGQKESTVAGVVQVLEEAGAMAYTCVISASSASPAPMQFVAPYVGAAMAEYFMYERGEDTLCIYDDLTKQAQAYRQLSLLLRRPPGREAYPGDVFYLHSRLLERAIKAAEKYVIVPKSFDPTKQEVTAQSAVNGKVYELHIHEQAEQHKQDLAALGADRHQTARIMKSGGSMTALPVIETQEGEVSAYIPTNVISITDGQIYLQPDLFYSGVRPAVDVGISVSRVGGNAQTKSMKSIAGSLRLDLASFRELEAFAQLGSDLDAATQAKLDRGYRMVEVLKQKQYVPMAMADQCMVLFAGVNGHLDSLAIDELARFERDFLDAIHKTHSEIPQALDEKRADLKMKPDNVVAVKLDEFLRKFVPEWKQKGASAAVDPR